MAERLSRFVVVRNRVVDLLRGRIACTIGRSACSDGWIGCRLLRLRRHARCIGRLAGLRA